jgi:hypothetical protein
MDTYDKNLNACLLHRNKQLTRQLKDYQQTLALTDCSSSLMLAMGQLLVFIGYNLMVLMTTCGRIGAIVCCYRVFYGGVCRKTWFRIN